MSEISKQIIDENFAYIVTTTIKNKRVLRMNMINCNTIDEDVISTVKRLDEIAHQILNSFSDPEHLS